MMRLSVGQILKILLITLLPMELFSQRIVDSNKILQNIQPVPQKIEAINQSIIIDKKFIPVCAEKEEEKKAADYFTYILKKNVTRNIRFQVCGNKDVPEDSWRIKLRLVEFKEEFVSEQYYSIKCLIHKKEIEIASPSQLGLLYAVSTFSKFITYENDSMEINLADIIDYPMYGRREFAAVLKSYEVDDLLNFALMNKIETVAISETISSWNKLDDEYKAVLEKIKIWKERFGGPRIMQIYNVHKNKVIEISNPDDVNKFKNIIKAGIENGVDKIMIKIDDTTSFEFGQGYVLASENDRNKFKTAAEADCFLINELNDWLKSEKYNVELYYCPYFGNNDDANYGDINLYKNTPWEKDAFEPFIRDLKYIGLNLPENVYVMWTGPRFVNEKITATDLNNWTNRLEGRIPFLADNSINDSSFSSPQIFAAWRNNLPSDFYLRTAGNGVFVNCDLSSEEQKASAVTANDYLWNPENYNPDKSLNMAMTNLYGKQTAEVLLRFKEAEMELRKKIGERQLWFEADSLWKTIRKVRFITEKNPSYYQQNYNRFKALRLQIKNSVPEPESKKEFMEICFSLDKKRKSILKELKKTNKELSTKIEKLLVELPDFNNIQ
jgi:hypothetical protein